MANINSLMSSTSSTNSLYGTRNVLSGLASGMDTEAMIENSISGYKTKISQLEKEQTKYEWKQDAYRSITDKMHDLTEKYTSYTSKTNLYSPAYFSNTVSTTPVSASAEAAASVSAKGRSSSDIQLLAAEAATAARYTVSANDLGLQTTSATTAGITNPNFTDNVAVGTLKGSLTLNYDGQTIDITFDETDNDIDGTNKTLADAIQDKLNKIDIETNNGKQKAGDIITVGTDNGKITFTENSAATNQGASPYISYIDSSLKSALSVSDKTRSNGYKEYTIGNADSSFTQSPTGAEYLADKEISVTLDGVTKTFKLNKDTILGTGGIAAAFNDAFGSVGMNVKATLNGDKLTFEPTPNTSNLSVSTKNEKAAELLGLGSGVSNYLDPKTAIKDILGSKFNFTPQPANTDGLTLKQESDGSAFYTDEKTGDRYQQVEGGDYYRVNDNGEYLYELTINSKSIYVSEKSTLQSVLDDINSSDMGVNASYSKLTGKFVFTAKDTGSSANISFDNDLSRSLFTGNTTNDVVKGTDATVRMTVNGEAITRTYASNEIDLDGMTVTLKGNINDLNKSDDVNKANAVSFSTSGGSDDLINTIKSFVDDYNAILKEVHDAYATMPAEKSSSTHARYEPLTDDDKNGMSDKAIENYEAKAKQGLLFGDSDLRALYETLVRNITPGGTDGAALRNIGIDVSYSDNTAQITLDETKLRDALNKDPDSVTNVFTRSKEGGSNSDGLMSNVKTTMEQYASTSYSNPGLLVRKAGSKYSSTSLLSNELQTQLDNVQKKIESWQSKMSTKIDYYTRQFTALEKLMNTMNSQSSALAGLMGG